MTELAGLVAEARAAAKPRKKLRLDDADGGEPASLGGSAGAKRPAGAKKAGQKKRKKRRVEAAVDTST